VYISQDGQCGFFNDGTFTCSGSRFGDYCTKGPIGLCNNMHLGCVGYCSNNGTTTSNSTITTATTDKIGSTNTVSSGMGSATTTTASTTTPVDPNALPTQTYSGGIAPPPAGTAVAVQNPSFEYSVAGASRRSLLGTGLSKRQSAAQLAASSAGWTISRCPSSKCEFENYDAADGIWAFSAANTGGTIYQDNVVLTPGATYEFSFYYKATQISNYNYIQSIYLGSTTSTDQLAGFIAGTANVAPNQGWLQQTFTLTLLCAQAQNYGQASPDGTVAYRMFVDADLNINAPGPYPLVWFVDEIRVTQTSLPAAGFSCPPFQMPTTGNVLTNPSFESLAITNTNDVNGFPTKAVNWTSTGCAGRMCSLSDAVADPNGQAHTGRYSEEWVSPTTYSQPVTLTVGTTYIASIWIQMAGSPPSNQVSTTTLSLGPAGGVPGAGVTLLSASIAHAAQPWGLYHAVFTVDAGFAGTYCSGGVQGASTNCVFTISGTYSGTPGGAAGTGVTNYFDDVLLVKQGWHL
jgi:hypothetical protein